MSCNCLEIVYGPRPSVEFLCPVRKIEFFPIAKGAPGDPGPEGPEGPEGPATTDASLLSTGTVPLGRLAGITNAQLSATAGILSSQIAGLDASKITGTFPLSLLSQGTTGQFLRGDGTYSNTLGYLLLSGGEIEDNYSQCVSQGPYGLLLWAASDESSNLTEGGSIFIYPTTNKDDGNPGGVEISPALKSAGFVKIYAPNFGERFRATNAGVSLTGDVSLSSAGKVIFGATGSGVAANREIYGLAGGVRTNTPTGTTITDSVAGTIVTTVSGTGLAVTGAMSASGNLTLSGSPGSIAKPNNTDYIAYCGGSGNNSTTGALIQVYGSSHATLPGNTEHYCGTNAGACHNFRDNTQVRQLRVSEVGVSLLGANKIIYGAAGTTTAANNETVGTITGPVTNAPSGSTVRTTIAGTTVVTVGASLLTVAGNIQFSATPSRVCGPAGNAGQIVLAGGSGADWTTGGIFRAWGNSSAQTGNVQMIPGNAAGALAEIYDRALVRQAFADANGFNINKVILTANTPATATSTGTAGQIAWDASGNIYICSATNTWRRVATSTF